MRRVGNFLFGLFFNLLMHLEGCVPALILLALHLWLGLSVWWCIAAFGILIVRFLFWFCFLVFVLFWVFEF